jgi:hypothetical protein
MFSVRRGLLLFARLLEPDRVSCGQLLRERCHRCNPLSSKHVRRLTQTDVQVSVQPLPHRPTIRLRILRVFCAVLSQPFPVPDLQLLPHSRQSPCRVFVVRVDLFCVVLPVQDEGDLQEAQGQAGGQGIAAHSQKHHILPISSRPSCSFAAHRLCARCRESGVGVSAAIVKRAGIGRQ